MTRVLTDALTDVGASNVRAVHNAISTTGRFFHDAASFRNFFAHRNDGTVRVVQRLAPRAGVSSKLHPAEMLAQVPAGENLPLCLVWIEQVMVSVSIACT